MPIVHQVITLATEPGISIRNITPQIREFLASSRVQNGQMLIVSQHTTTAIAINEDEERLLEDTKFHLQKLAPPAGHYLHNDLHLRDVPENEPINAHSHLMAMMLSTSEVVPIVAGDLALGTWQSILLFDLDGPRQRSVFLQASGEF